MGSTSAVTGVKPGDILAQKYRIDRILGSGGMGVVVAAHHLGLDERVAIKFLLPDATSSTEAVARFEHEARAAVKIKSEHVARVSDVGKLESGAPYMVMEYLEGEDLARWLTRRGPLPFEQAADFILQACEAIAEAHALGIIHRDLKPANLFVIRRPDGAFSVKVLDFGISKRLSGAALPDVAITKTAMTIGSPLYMSPEQLQSTRDVDVRSDIWALGIILYELTAGQSPFASSTLAEFVTKVLSTAPASLVSLRADTPPGFDALVSRCLERDRARRYESVGHLAADLLRFAPLRSRISLERIAGVLGTFAFSATLLDAPATVPSADISAGRAAVSVARPRKRSRVLLWLLAGFALLAVGALFVHLRRAPSANPELAHTPRAAATPPATRVSTITTAAPIATTAPSPPPSSTTSATVLVTSPLRAPARKAEPKATTSAKPTPTPSASSESPTAEDTASAFDDRK